MGKANFYHDEPLFGLDIGHSSLKVMQLETVQGRKPKVLGYGVGWYPPESISSGVVVNYDALKKALYDLFNEHIVGGISTKRVACTIPTARTFSRPMKVPPLSDKDLMEAVQLEAGQYIPVPLTNLYIDFDVTRRDEQSVELLMVATPKNIIDSHVKLLQQVGLEPIALEPTMNASARFFSLVDASHNQPSILIDFGSVAIDVAVFDKTMFVNSTVATGNDTLTSLIAKKLGISPQEAYDIKNNQGINPGQRQAEIREAIQPLLENLVREIRKIVRYYNERGSQAQRRIVQIITIGGGSTMPGLNEYLTQELKLPTHVLDPWNQLDFENLMPPPQAERPMYTTVAGEAILDSRSILI